jgi:hypothetical protein
MTKNVNATPARPWSISVALLFFFFCSIDAFAQCAFDAPQLTISSDTITVVGKNFHISAPLPRRGEHWLYSVSCHTSSLFDFSWWTFSRFHDRDGLFLAKSWNLQVLDSPEAPEQEVTFENENQFYFWGGVTQVKGGERVRFDHIVGLPNTLHGDAMLHEIPRSGP